METARTAVKRFALFPEKPDCYFTPGLPSLPSASGLQQPRRVAPSSAASAESAAGVGNAATLRSKHETNRGAAAAAVVSSSPAALVTPSPEGVFV